MKARQTIAVDIDDVLAEHIEDFLKFSNERYGTNFKPEDYHGRWHILWGISHEEVEKRAVNFHIPETLNNFAVVKDAKEVLTELKKKYDLVIVTARPRMTVEATKEWIKNQFTDIFSSIHFVPIWEPNNKLTKADICRKIGADYLIDDLVRHCNLAAEVGIKPILFDRIKWAQPETPHPKIIRVNNWQEVLEYFNEEG